MSNHTPETVTIQLTKGHVAIVDKQDADLAEHTWYATTTTGNKYPYAVRAIQADGRNVKVRLHRIILERMINRPLEDDELCDHINRDTLDNRRENLRLATKGQNAFNRKAQSNSPTGYKGVRICRDGTYRAVITVNGKTRRLGYRYATPEEAYVIYCRAARELFGEFACADEESVAGVIPVRVNNDLGAVADHQNTTLEELLPAMFEQFPSAKAIAKELGVSSVNVQRSLKRLGYRFVRNKWVRP